MSKNQDKSEGQSVDVEFESHPPIEDDLNGVTTLLRQTLLQFADCHSLAQYLVKLKDVTQVIAQETLDEENTSEDDEPDNDIYGVSSVIDLSLENDNESHKEARLQLLNFILDKCPNLKAVLHEKPDRKSKLALMINERYINLPPLLALLTLKDLNHHLSSSHYDYLVFITKVLIQSKNSNSTLPNKKRKLGQSSARNIEAEPIIYLNPEEEIINEGAEFYSDLDISSFCDENASWSFASDVKYVPYRRIIVVNSKNWPTIMNNLEKELQG